LKSKVDLKKITKQVFEDNKASRSHRLNVTNFSNCLGNNGFQDVLDFFPLPACNIQQMARNTKKINYSASLHSTNPHTFGSNITAHSLIKYPVHADYENIHNFIHSC
jgi:hypothetical protein